MRRPQEDQRLWAVVAATVRPLEGRAAPSRPVSAAPTAPPAVKTKTPPSFPAEAVARTPAPPLRAKPPPPPGLIEPNRLHRIDRGREAVTAVLDLHGLDQDAARRALEGFVVRHFEAHHRTVLVITGKGLLGDGVLRRRAPEWLAEPPLRALVAGISEAHRRRGGEGALYVALKRNPGTGRRG